MEKVEIRYKIMLKIEHLSKNYGNKKAVDDLSLHVAPGTICGFIGHNGAGKTTTLKAVAGILQFDSGEIYIDGKSIRTRHWSAREALPIFQTIQNCMIT